MGENTPTSESGTAGEDRGKQVLRIVEQARKLPSQDRSAFLAEACSDGKIRAEIETFLGHGVLVGRSPLPTQEPTKELASRAAYVADDEVPDLPDHDLVKRIGGGGFGDVYLAKNRHDRQWCAVKVVRKWTECEMAGLRRFKSCVAEHPNLVPIHHVGRVGDVVYYLMPLADHAVGAWPVHDPMDYVPMTLSRRARRMGPLPSEEVAEICEAIAAGLSHMHANGAVHGDVKPDNVFLVGGHWRLGDYSLVSDADTRAPRGATAGFVPPDGAGTPESDAYALGMTGLLLLNGQTGEDGLESLLSRLRQGDRSEYHRRLVEICSRLIEPRPSRRWTVSDAVRALTSLVDTGRSPHGSGATTLRPWRSRWPAGVGCGLMVIAPSALLAFQHRPPFATLTLIVGSAVAVAAVVVATASGSRTRAPARLLVTLAAGAIILWTGYLFAWNLTTVRSPDPDSSHRYQIGYHMAPWTFTEEARGKMTGLPVELDEPFAVMMAFAAYQDGKIPTVWAPWSVVTAGILLIATFGLGCGLWAFFCTAAGYRLLDSTADP